MREGAELLVEAGQFYEVPPGHEAWVVGDEPWITDRMAAEGTAFVQTEGGGFDRVVATLLVTDIVDSTARALELGDGGGATCWPGTMGGEGPARPIRGREVATTGDGFVACSTALSEPSVPLRRSVGRHRRSARGPSRVHTGEIELEGGNVRGAAMHIAARIADLAEPGRSMRRGRPESSGGLRRRLH